jgi:hypothetical protein
VAAAGCCCGRGLPPCAQCGPWRPQREALLTPQEGDGVCQGVGFLDSWCHTHVPACCCCCTAFSHIRRPARLCTCLAALPAASHPTPTSTTPWQAVHLPTTSPAHTPPPLSALLGPTPGAQRAGVL